MNVEDGGALVHHYSLYGPVTGCRRLANLMGDLEREDLSDYYCGLL